MHVCMSYRNSVVDTGSYNGQLKPSLKERALLISDDGSREGQVWVELYCVLYKEVRSSTG